MSKISKTGVLQTIRQISSTAAMRVGKKKGRSLHITGAFCVGNTLIGLGKLVMGITSLSFFTCASAFYTFGMVTAKCFVLAGIVKEDNSKEQYKYYKISGMILILASLLYIIYSIRLFLHPVTEYYDKYSAISIAAFTFAELAINIRGVLVERHNHSPLMHAIKMINLASSLICLVLTQTALLSISSEASDAQPLANGFMGILMGFGAVLLGVFMIIRITQIQFETNYRSAYRKTKKLIRREKLKVKIVPAHYRKEENQPARLYISFYKAEREADYRKLCSLTTERLNIHLILEDVS